MNDHRGVLDCRGREIRGEPIGDRGAAFQLLASAHQSCGSDAAEDKRFNGCASDLTRRTGDDWMVAFNHRLDPDRHFIGFSLTIPTTSSLARKVTALFVSIST